MCDIKLLYILYKNFLESYQQQNFIENLVCLMRKGVHGAVANATGWGGPTQGSIPRCCTIYSNLWHGAHLLVTAATTPFG
jgi:hypothetical protein